MAEKICAAAVDAATYAIHKLYSYRVPDELREQVQIGTRVLVPFGFGNKRAEAVVLAFREDAGEFKLKPIVEVLDETPILTAEQLNSFGELPSKDALIAQVLGTFLAPISSLAFVLDQIRIQKEGPAPAEEAPAEA